MNLPLFEVSEKKELKSLKLELKKLLSDIDEESKIEMINEIKKELHEYSPFKNEPVDCVVWVKALDVFANDYNPNSVAPPEMKLLELSIREDGYTQPIVSYKHDGIFEVVDGFHRNRVGRESEEIQKRILGYLPLVVINEGRQDKGDRIASTIRHNRARGKHQVEAMSDIVVELKKRNWSDEKIADNLGMEPDEVLRLCQVSGLAEMFQDTEFSKSWNVEDLENNFEGIEEDESMVTTEPGRILHTWEKWECFKAGFYENKKEGMEKGECEEEYRKFLADIPRFEKALKRVLKEWKNSCEHYLTNESMNRIAWLGQAALCIETGIPACFRGGYNLMTDKQKKEADEMALKYLNKWLASNDRPMVDLDGAGVKAEVNIY